MKYTITGIGDFHFSFVHYPPSSGGYLGSGESSCASVIELKLVMYKGLQLNPDPKAKPVNEARITFLEGILDDVVKEATQDKVSIHLPIYSFDTFYKKLSEVLNDNKYKVILETEGALGLTSAIFTFILHS